MTGLSLRDARFRLAEADAAAVDALARSQSVHPVLARCLVARGWTDEGRCRSLLAPSMDDLHDPFRMLGMDRAVDRLRRAVTDRESIRIITDYDVDGTTSSLILQAVLRILGARHQISYHIPDRFSEGYGLSEAAVERAAADSVRLLVTADIGVRDHAAVTRACALGLDVIVCDHHLPAGEEVPADATAVLCPPQRGCPYPNRSLAACGVSLKVAQALLRGRPDAGPIVASLLKIAAIGTVADMVGLDTPENRAIVRLGLEGLAERQRNPGLAALLRIAGVEGRPITAGDLGFRIGPRINAAGRIQHATAVIELFDAPDRPTAERLAAEIDALNRERQEIQTRLVDRILASLPATPDPFVVVAGPEKDGWHRGVVGIAASRVREAVDRPAAVGAIHGELTVGSVRSTDEVHAIEALDSAADLLVKFGGHSKAAGFTVRTDRLDALRARLCAFATARAPADRTRVRPCDAQLDPGQLDRALHAALSRLEPFGMGNPAPVLWVRAGRAAGLRVLKERHLRFDLAPRVSAIWFGAGEHMEALAGAARIEVAGRLEINRYQGTETLQVQVEDAVVDPG